LSNICQAWEFPKPFIFSKSMYNFGMQNYQIETSYGDIGLINDDSHSGYVDVIFHFRMPPDFIDPKFVIEVRVYYRDASMTIEQLKTESRLVALASLSQLLRLSEAQDLSPEIQSRWL
jgi:hypothetical protein